MCLRGASATEKLLSEKSNADVRVFVVWERVRFIDFAAPSTATLARISDPRVSQYWDKDRLVSHLMGEHDDSGIVWDNISVFAPGTLWKDSLPQPTYSEAPVARVIDGAKNSIENMLAAARPAGK